MGRLLFIHILSRLKVHLSAFILKTFSELISDSKLQYKLGAKLVRVKIEPINIKSIDLLCGLDP